MNQKTWTIILNVYLEIILIANVNTDSIAYIPGRDSVPLHTSVHQQYVSCLQNTIFVTIFEMWLDFSWRKLKIKILVNLSDSPRDIYSTEFHIQYSHPDLTIPVTVWWSMGNYTKQKSGEAHYLQNWSKWCFLTIWMPLKHFKIMFISSCNTEHLFCVMSQYVQFNMILLWKSQRVSVASISHNHTDMIPLTHLSNHLQMYIGETMAATGRVCVCVCVSNTHM